jgi:agmatinase
VSGGSPADMPPRFSGIRTFARLEHSRELRGRDVAVIGVPFDVGTSFRPGARFGPEAIRSASVLLRPYHPGLELDVLTTVDAVDWGDVEVGPGNVERGLAEIADQLAQPLASGARSLLLGGDHSIALAELRAHAERQGSPVAVVLLDSHPDTWDSYRGERYFHGTPFRRAAEEGVVAPERSLLAGMRGPVYSERDLSDAERLGFELIRWEELRRMEPAEYGERARGRVGGGPSLLSFDVDFVDPAFAPATGTPEPGGPSSSQALELLRALTGIEFCGFDVVEVSPPYDGPGQVTSLLASAVAYEMLGLVARSKLGVQE